MRRVMSLGTGFIGGFMKRTVRTLSLLAGIFLAGCTTVSTANKDGWQDKTTAVPLDEAMRRQGFMPASMDCRIDGREIYGSRFTWKPNPKNKRWEWQVGEPNFVAANRAAMLKLGLHRVSHKSVRDSATGQTVECAIWTN